MTTATITKTRDFLVIKIPLKTFQKEQAFPISVEEKKAIEEGLRAITEGKVSKSFQTSSEAVSFLRTL